jgi:hypothetical protein
VHGPSGEAGSAHPHAAPFRLPCFHTGRTIDEREDAPKQPSATSLGPVGGSYIHASQIVASRAVHEAISGGKCR